MYIMKTRNSILLVAAFVLCLGLSAQSTKQDRPVGEFSKISSASGIDVYFTQGNKHSLQIEADAENMDKIESKVENGKLSLKCKDGAKFKNNSTIKAYVSAKNIEDISLSGAADFYTTSITNNTVLNVSSSGAADFKADKVTAKDCKLSFSGGSDCDIRNLTAEMVKLNFSGGSDADVYAISATNIEANASGGSDITLSGKTRNITINCSGGSDGNVKNLSYEKITANKSGGSDIIK